MPLHSAYVRAWRFMVRVLAVSGLVFVLATCTPIDRWWANALAGQQYYQSGDVLIVLSGSVFEDGTMGWNSYLRSKYTVLSFRPGGFRQVLVSGGQPYGPPVALAMADWMRCHGIPAKEISVDSASTSTRESALHTRDLLNRMTGRKVLLTSDYNMFRASHVFSKMGIQVLPQPIPDARKRLGSWVSRWPVFCELAIETVKIGYYWWRGWI